MCIGKSVAQVSLRWLLQKPNVTSVIVGVRTVKQLEDNMGAGTDWLLDSGDVSTRALIQVLFSLVISTVYTKCLCFQLVNVLMATLVTRWRSTNSLVVRCIL